jgi:hypothetical protein
MAEAMYRWAHIISKKRVRKRDRAKKNWMKTLSQFARSTADMPAFVGVGLLTCIFFLFYFTPFVISDGSSLPSFLATLAFLDSLFIYPIAVNVAAISSSVIASYMNYKIK